MEYKNKSDTSNNTSNWNHLKIIHKLPAQPIGKARNQGTTESIHICHCTVGEYKHKTLEMGDITYIINYKYSIAATLCILETWSVSGT